MFNVSISLVNNIRRGERWSSVQIENEKVALASETSTSPGA